jgi:transposase
MTTRKHDTPKTTRRFKRWPIELKRRIVEETFVLGASVSIVARRHDANANQVFGWRKQYQQGILVDKTAKTHDLIRVGVVDPCGARPLPVVTGKATAGSNRRVGVIEITLSGGIKVRVDDGIYEAVLRRVLTVVKDVT